MALVRRCSVCGAVVRQGDRCGCQKLRHKRYDREHRDKERADFYSSGVWKRVADAARARANYADEYALRYDRKLLSGKIVHHVVPVEDDPGRRLDLGNLVCVSPKTHDMIHRAYEAGEREKREMMEQLFAIRGEGSGRSR